LDTVSVYVLDGRPDDQDAPAREPRILPVGEAGELALGGHQLAAGYINRPEQTAAAFVDTRHGRLYRTGDRARIRNDGTIECLGRISDGQVKLRGQRIELGEIEQAALRTQGCHGAVASVVAGNLVLFCTVDRRGGIDDDVLESCRSWLPRFMVPNDVVLLEEFPRLPSGKVDRRRIGRDYKESSGPESSDNAAFVDDLERRLCEAGERILGSPVDSTTILSKLGMDSLQSIRYASMLRNQGLDVSAIEVLGAKTLRDLYLLVAQGESRERGHGPRGLPSLLDGATLAHASKQVGERLDEVEDVFACTPLQASMLAETAANPVAYCNWIEVLFPRDSSVETITAAFRSISQCNQILRTGFLHYRGKYVQVVWKSLVSSQILAVREFDNRFSLDTDDAFLEPFRVQIRDTCDGGGPGALVQLHHALYDGWSVDLMLLDLDSYLRGKGVHQRPPFSSVAEDRASTPSRVTDASKRFWAESFLNFQPCPPPDLRETTAGQHQTLTHGVRVNMDPKTIRSFSMSLEVGPQVVFQAALLWLWAGLVGREDVVIGSVGSGRTSHVPHVDQVMGPCLETVPLRLDLSKMRTIREVLDSVHAANRAALPHSSLPLLDIKRVAGFLPGQALYDVIFVYQESLHSGDRGGLLLKEVARLDNLETRLLVEVEPVDNYFHFRITYQTEAWSPAQAELLMEQFRYVVGHLVEHVNADVSSVRDCFPSALLSSHNVAPPSGSLPGNTNLAALVSAASRRAPDDPAICFARSTADSVTITYRQLDAVSNRIAWLLRGFGVREGMVVAIIMEKSVLLYEGILGILKAGCAYLPLLPSTPFARIATILRQADVQFCLADTAAKDALRRLDCKLLDLQAVDVHQARGEPLPVRIGSEQIANVVYTSGTTGAPKGVCVTHLNIASNLDVLSRLYPVEKGSRLLQSCSQAFDVSVFEIFFAWTRGMCLCAAVNDVLFADLERAIRFLKVTHLSMTPSVAALVRPQAVPRVRFLVTAGEPMTEELLKSWGAHLYQGKRRVPRDDTLGLAP